MIFPLVPVTLNQPLPTIGQPLFRDMPIVPLRLMHGTNVTRGRVFVDSMSDIVAFPEQVAQHLNIDLTNSPSRTISAVGGGQVVVRFAEITLEMTGPIQRVRWRAVVGFGAVTRWLFGHFGGLEYFHFTLDPANEELILVPRANLPTVP